MCPWEGLCATAGIEEAHSNEVNATATEGQVNPAAQPTHAILSNITDLIIIVLCLSFRTAMLLDQFGCCSFRVLCFENKTTQLCFSAFLFFYPVLSSQLVAVAARY